MAAKTIYAFRIKASMAYVLVENAIAGSRAPEGRQKGMVVRNDQCDKKCSSRKQSLEKQSDNDTKIWDAPDLNG